MTRVGAFLLWQQFRMSAANTKFSEMHLPVMKPVWLGFTRSGIIFWSLLVRVLAIALIGQFCKDIGRNASGVRAFSFLGIRTM
jgi:hypothetical protein